MEIRCKMLIGGTGSERRTGGRVVMLGGVSVLERRTRKSGGKAPGLSMVLRKL